MSDFTKQEIEIAEKLRKEGNVAQAVALYEAAANLDSVDAMRELGLIYYSGEGEVAQDYDKAFKWLSAAESYGDARATEILAEMYAAGNGVPSNVYRALELTKFAADRGSVDSMKALIAFYEEEAAYWRRRAEKA